MPTHARLVIDGSHWSLSFYQPILLVLIMSLSILCWWGGVSEWSSEQMVPGSLKKENVAHSPLSVA